VLLMTEEARLEEVGSGLVPASDGWFVVNARDAAWATNDAFGSRCVLEASPRVVPDRPDLQRRFEQVGVNLDVVAPGQASGLYHAEGDQEDFLVLHGECVLLIAGEERRLRAWDFVHCPPGTEHVFVGAGDGPCVIFMVGHRGATKELRYPRSELALEHRAGVDTETTSAREAYGPFPRWRPQRPSTWDELPWTS
jgi:uncharacterized cupin superfamily protein